MSRLARLGAFIFVTLAVLACGVFIIGSKEYLFSSTYKLRAQFQNVVGLAEGAEVMALIKASFVILVAGDAPLRVSARNRLAGTVVSLDEGAVNSEVTLRLADGKTLVATITRQSVLDLALKVGDPATALVKASHVILAVE